MDKKDDQNLAKSLSDLKVYFAGLLALSLVLLPVIFSLGVLDLPAFISVIALAVAIPSLTACFAATAFFDLNLESSVMWGMFAIVTWIAILALLVSIISAFWHITWIAGVVFLGTAFISYITIILPLFIRKLKSLMNPVRESKEGFN